MIRICFLWHMHQPFYKDLISGEYKMPWTRMHALKDYLGMVEMLGSFPDVRMTFNLVPSLLVQIEEYASGTAHDPLLDLVLKPAADLTPDEKRAALANLFQANPERLIARYPRYRQLYDLYRSAGFTAERALPLFSTRELTDLQVLSQLAWFDEIYLEGDAEIRALIAKRQGYSRSDQQVLERKERELIGRITGAYRAAEERGQVELSTSPFYHPILPLLCDTAAGEESHPGLPLPRRFRHPEDAGVQLERAVALHTRLFGHAPRGLWPSEGSVSGEALSLAADLGFQWAATGEGVLCRSIGSVFWRDPQGVPANAAALYGGYDLLLPRDRRIRVFFRDHQLSDLIGFVYANMTPRDAAGSLLERLRRCGRAAASAVPDPVIPVILDGENAWEYYPKNGREFLGELYAGLERDPEMRAATFSEALELPPRGQLSHIVPGSWINANFDIWIGAEQDNRAWNLLSDARDFFRRAEQPPPSAVSREKLEMAREELLIAEGSDWNWWYGPEHHTANDLHFDELYRSHLANVYRALGEPPPDALAIPIATHIELAYSCAPANYIRPKVDGRVSSYFEWMGAGIYSLDQRTSAMHGKRFYLREIYYGLDGANFYLRLDFNAEGLRALETSEVRVNFAAGDRQCGLSARLTIGENNARPVLLELRCNSERRPVAPPEAEASFRNILELRASLEALGLASVERFSFQVILWEAGLPVDLFPAQGWLELETAEPPQQR